MGARPMPIEPAWLAATMAALVDTYHVPGAQLAVHRGGVTVAVELGELEYGAGIEVTGDTPFAIGSITKAWTATLAMILVADGDMELDAPLDEYLPELPDLGGVVTLRHVLSHTSGFASSPDVPDLSTLSLGRYVREHCRRQDLISSPGTGFSYSNRNYALVGHLIETITGMRWAEAMESILLRPLAVESTILGRGTAPSARAIAAGHSVNMTSGKTRPVSQSLASVEAPAGALAMSAVDLVALGTMHVGSGVSELVPAAYAKWMRQAVPGADPFGLADGWGCGLAIFREGTTNWVGHDGNVSGMSCYLRIEPAEGWVVALTTNANTGSYLWDELCTALRPPTLPLPVHRRDLPARAAIASPAECVGRYSNGPAEYDVTAAEGGDLYLANGDELVARLVFYDRLDFVLQDVMSGRRVHVGRFLRDPATKQIDHVLIGGRLAQRQRPATLPKARSPADSVRPLSA
ncbi:MAG: serine hydrolase domain-containing protein [Pseudonocardiaceae bacterium]